MAVSLICEHKDELAGVSVAPLQRVITSEPGFLEAAREIKREFGMPLIFDEVVTGFRFAYGGAQELSGVTPHLCALGKVIGGGYPLSAVAGREAFMKYFDADEVGVENTVKKIRTLSGNPVAAAAGLATLEILKKPGTFEQLFATGQRFMNGLTGLIATHGVRGQVRGVPPMFDILFTDADVTVYRGAAQSISAKLEVFNEQVLRGVLLKRDNKFYVSTAHTAKGIEEAPAICEIALAAVAKV